MNPGTHRIVILAALLAAARATGLSAGESPATGPNPASASAPASGASWQAPSAEQVRTRVMAWLEARGADESAKQKAAEVWASVPADAGELDVLAALSATVALVDENARSLGTLCAKPKSQLIVPSQPWLDDPATDPLVARNMRLLFGRWLVHEAMFDEAVEQLGALRPEDVVAPATLLFYQGVAYHSLLQKTPGLESIGKLLSAPERSPRRYVAVARLMEEDLKSLEDDSLDHVARRMDDVRRRLDLGRAGRKVRDVEDGIIESLDKIIKRLEEQAAAAAAAGGGAQDNIRSSSPAPDSMPIGGKGPGEVDRRPIGSEADWGNLPPKQREEALQRIGRDFPSHYRDVVEQYFRRLAAEGSER